MEAGKERLTRDTVRDPTRQEIEHLMRENYDLKQLVADLSLVVHRFKKRPSQPLKGPQAQSAQEKSEVLARVEETKWGKRKLLAQLQVPRSTYYRWRARERQGKQACLARVLGTGLAYRKRPQYWRRQGSLRNGAAGNWPLGSPTTWAYQWVNLRCTES